MPLKQIRAILSRIQSRCSNTCIAPNHVTILSQRTIITFHLSNLNLFAVSPLTLAFALPLHET
jgi:hypothetical protein